MTLARVTVLGTGDGVDFGQVEKVFKKKCRIYVSTGEIETADIPADQTELAALYADGTGEFAPFGNMDEGIGQIKYKQSNEKIDFHTIYGDFSVEASLASVILDEGMLAWFDDAESKGILSFLFVPDGVDDLFLALSGVTLGIEDGLIDLGGKKSVNNMKLTRDSNALGDIIKFAQSLPAGA